MKSSTVTVLVYVLVGILLGCKSTAKEDDNNSVKVDTVYFGTASNTKFEDRVGPFDIVNLNDYPLTRLYEDSTFQVKVTTGKQKNLKVLLRTSNTNVEIAETDTLNQFVIKTKPLTTTTEWVPLSVHVDTMVNRLVIINREVDSKGCYKDNRLPSDTIVRIEIKNHKKENNAR